MDRYGSSFEWYPPPSKPRLADGLRARSRRGAIGDTWWSKRFIDVLESFHMGTRLTRGRSYARAGQVLELEVTPGEVTSSVQGSRVKPYKVSIRLLPLSEKDWTMVEQAMEERAVFLAKLLAGDMPHDIEEVFSSCRLSLFPESLRDLSTDCSCPDWANPCKHIAATFYLLAEAFDGDPFLIFQWRGRTKQELLSRLVTRGGGTQAAAFTGTDLPGKHPVALWPVSLSVDPVPLNECIESFYECARDFAGVNFSVQEGVPHDAILNELGDLPFDLDGIPVTDLLRPAYDAMARAVEDYITRSTPGI
ncbi:MAG: SWIM zinc finger family protein [Actinobacteria bacterium]|nr:SWIM zinc finger family protein [Actinomycetota bacterium]